MLDDFAVFILSHGRADKVDTFKTLKRCGYTGRVYIVIDNEDGQAEKYYQNFGRDMVIMFDKAAIAETFDEGDNFQDRRAVIYARNACFDIARDLGVKYFMQLDDDYTSFDYRFDNDFNCGYWNVINLDAIFVLMLEFYKKTNFFSVAFLQHGDMLGGVDGQYSKKVKTYRKAMNTFICGVDRPFNFFGRINEDVNTYTAYQNRGNCFLSINNVVINQKATQKNSGGMTELYLDSGTYIKSFYTVMYLPSAVSVGIMRSDNKRLHHSIKWDNAVPAIISERWRK